ncbi:zf-HC2 domain-containing protein [Micromonospora sp. WMMD1128]|uniref:anti-sigma factor family protein n=1 Tax=unclassified Micromonospora TaxID=2617518 RepID=UPI00248ACBDF|nr:MULTISPECIES: zf-HC2 domain-containing protein [unclassified Micromonospora]WBB72065.1 zf-HC2 domain-containing protein [Micromonospora sp. WMMD1128]WFE34474.1 zf-HC2 domain-containing protein [Micromonospora sp. WMMD975]
MSRADHMDVAAYALGVLDAQDAERFEEHLATCWACAAELETMVPVVGMLSGIDGEAMAALEQTHTDPALLDRTLVAVRRDRRRTRVRQLLATAAAVVVLGGVSGVAAGMLGDDSAPVPRAEPTQSVPTAAPSGGPVDPNQPGVGGNEQEGEEHNATDAGTGVKTTMWLAKKEYGTQIALQLSRLPGPRTCRLLVVRKNATSEVVGTWSVPGSGYGTNQNPLGLELTASTSAPLGDIEKVQVQSVDVNGVASPLVTVSDL